MLPLAKGGQKGDQAPSVKEEIGNVSSKFENQSNKAITSCFYAVKPSVVYNTRVVGHTTQRLADRIKQHVPMSIRKKSSTVREQPPHKCKNISSKSNCEPAIGQHLITNPECAKTYTDDNFRIIGQVRSSFNLGVLESIYIKTQNPVLCGQKEFVFSLKLFN